jgi:hypothetical protein
MITNTLATVHQDMIVEQQQSKNLFGILEILFYLIRSTK